jgi:hypothetical protein
LYVLLGCPDHGLADFGQQERRTDDGVGAAAVDEGTDPEGFEGADAHTQEGVLLMSDYAFDLAPTERRHRCRVLWISIQSLQHRGDDLVVADIAVVDLRLADSMELPLAEDFHYRLIQLATGSHQVVVSLLTGKSAISGGVLKAMHSLVKCRFGCFELANLCSRQVDDCGDTAPQRNIRPWFGIPIWGLL